jgi:putative membrane protein
MSQKRSPVSRDSFFLFETQSESELCRKPDEPMNFLVNLIISAIAVSISAFLIPHIEVEGFGWAIVAAALLSVMNRFVKPVFLLLTLPINILTLGLFSFVINAVLVHLVSWIMSPHFRAEGFWAALIFSLVLSVVNAILDSMAGD